MVVKSWRFVTLLLAALAMAMEVSHLISMPERLSWDGITWLDATVPGSFFRPFGSFGQVTETAAWVCALVLVVLVRNHRRPVMRLTLIATAQFILALVVWWLFVYPAETEVAGWTAETLPRNWSNWRVQSEYAHALRALVLLAGFAILLLSVVIDTPDRPKPLEEV